MFFGCTSDEEDVVFMVSLYGMLGFTLLGMVGGAIGSLWGSKATLACLRIGIAGQALSFLGGLVLARVS